MQKTKIKISVCLIVKNEPLLEECILSFREFVDEVVIVDTGSTDGKTQEIAKKYADHFEIFTECNDPVTGLIEDFSKARQRSFDLAKYQTVLWLDADDILVGAEHLFLLLADAQKLESQNISACFLFPYEYSYDANGKCTLRHYRERFFYNKNLYKFVNPVHEVCCPIENYNIAMIPREELIFKHRRQYSSKQPESGRNLRILRKYYEVVGESDPRQMYYLGLECCNAGLIDEGIKFLIRYIELSGWDDERVMACLKLVDIYQSLAQYDIGLKWAYRAVDIIENWAEGYFAIGRMYYFLALNGGSNERRLWEKCIYFIKLGLQLPPTKTLLFINPSERDILIFEYLNMAQNKIGHVQEALESVNAGLKNDPANANFLNNKSLYEIFLARDAAVVALNKLKEAGELNQTSVEMITALLNKQPIKINETIEPKIVPETNVFPKAIITLNQQDWHIPNCFDFYSLPMDLTVEQLQATVIMIWKQFMLHDEVLSAISFLEKAPYVVRHSLATEKALKQTTACLDWMDSKIDFQKINAPINPEVEAGNPLPNKLIMSEGHRFDLIADHLDPHSTLVDFGSMDGCFTNRYGMLGHSPIGLDVCESSVKLANKKATEFKTGAKHICTYFQDAIDKVPNNFFDFATSSDTYEHLKDPVREMLLPAKKILKKDGKFLLATPYGAWMKGQYLSWSHPWVWEKEGKSWLQPSPRAHLIAPTQWTVAKHFREAEFWVKNCYVDLCNPSWADVAGQGNIFAEAYSQPPTNYPKLDIVFFAGNAPECYTPKSVESTGIGGSETVLIEISKRLAGLGHKVRVYAGVGEHGEGIYNGVEWYQTNKFQDLTCDISIISRRADYLADQFNITAKLKLLWIHDVCAINATNELLLKADRILCLSEWHKQNIINVHNIHPDQIIVTRNGIDLKRFDKKIERKKYKAICSSSPDRYLPVLLQMWPEIKKAVPDAELTICYGFKNWEVSARTDQLQLNLINRLKLTLKELEPLGVNFIDRVNQQQLAEEMLSSSLLLYSTWFSETFFVGGAEAQAAGLRIISSPIAAINETVGDRAFALIPGEWTCKEYQDQFIASTIQAFHKEDESDRISSQIYARNNFCLDELARDWQKMFDDLLGEIKINPIFPYYPTVNYR